MTARSLPLFGFDRSREGSRNRRSRRRPAGRNKFVARFGGPPIRREDFALADVPAALPGWQRLAAAVAIARLADCDIVDADGEVDATDRLSGTAATFFSNGRRRSR